MRRDMTAKGDPLGYASVRCDTFSDVAENNKKTARSEIRRKEKVEECSKN